MVITKPMVQGIANIPKVSAHEPVRSSARPIIIGPTMVPRHIDGQTAVGIEQGWAGDWRGRWTSLGDFFDSGPLGDNDGCCPTFVPELQGYSILYQCDKLCSNLRLSRF